MELQTALHTRISVPKVKAATLPPEAFDKTARYPCA
jgi:hypothetical protein